MDEKALKPLDTLGNEIHDGDLVCWTPDRPILCRVTKAQAAELKILTKSVEPGKVSFAFIMNVVFLPGQRITSLIRIVNPGSDALVNSLLDS